MVSCTVRRSRPPLRRLRRGTADAAVCLLKARVTRAYAACANTTCVITRLGRARQP
jgi:hypothetical protein